MGAVDEALGQVELAVRGEMVGEALEDGLEHAALDPTLIATVSPLVRRIAPRKIRPRRTCAENPQRGVDDVTRGLPRPARLLPRAPLAGRDVQLDCRPLRVREVHRVVRSHLAIAVDPRFGATTRMGPREGHDDWARIRSGPGKPARSRQAKSPRFLRQRRKPSKRADVIVTEARAEARPLMRCVLAS